jgi:L-methionine (R)-S-oxide reductase
MSTVQRLSPAEQAEARSVAIDPSWRLDLLDLSSQPLPLDDLAALFTYRIPLDTGSDGCARPGVFEPEPFDLHRALTRRGFGEGDVDAFEARRLSQLRAVVAHVGRCTGAEWVGVYRVIQSDPATYPVLAGSELTLLKEAYVGAPSRPFFPLTAAFASKSNNSTVGMTGDAVLIHDTRQLDADTPYYSCDGHVRSELCAPITEPGTGRILGIMDVEAFAPRFFSPERVACVLDACSQLAQMRLFVDEART